MSATIVNFRCPNCGHSDRMHVRGSSPRYAGCMVRNLEAKGERKPTCLCTLTPEQVRDSTTETIKAHLP